MKKVDNSIKLLSIRVATLVFNEKIVGRMLILMVIGLWFNYEFVFK